MMSASKQTYQRPWASIDGEDHHDDQYQMLPYLMGGVNIGGDQTAKVMNELNVNNENGLAHLNPTLLFEKPRNEHFRKTLSQLE